MTNEEMLELVNMHQRAMSKSWDVTNKHKYVKGVNVAEESLWEASGTHRDREEQEDGSNRGVVPWADNKLNKDPPKPFRQSWRNKFNPTQHCNRTAILLPVHAVVSCRAQPWAQCDGTTLDNCGEWAYIGTWVFEYTWELQDLNHLVYPVHVQKLLSVWPFQKYSTK